MKANLYTFYEFFAGGGLARAGLGPRWRCLFANDFDHKKSSSYTANWGDRELLTKDIWQISLADLPRGVPDLVWASFPCQDLSLAGGGAGLKGDRSGTFWPFWTLVKDLAANRGKPRVIVLENVLGTLSSHKGMDFNTIVRAFVEQGYVVGAVVIDAQLFVPQSRPRLFFVAVPAVRHGVVVNVLPQAPSAWHTPALLKAHASLPTQLKAHWIWWNMPIPAKRTKILTDVVEESPLGVEWHSPAETDRLLKMMTPLHRQKVEKARKTKRRAVGAVYRRMRPSVEGTIQRAEVRFDDVAGCLRTPAGGSSRQVLLIVEDGEIRSRLISARETARLMGLDDRYLLPDRYNDAYHLTGDGVVVPVVRHLAEHIIEPQVSPLSRKNAA